MPSLADKRVVLLDAGGTLITIDYDRVREVLAACGCQPDDATFGSAEPAAQVWVDAALRRGAPPRELWDGYFGRLFAGAGVPEDAIPAALGDLWLANRRVGLWRRPIQGALETVARLAAEGRRLAVVSNAEGQVEADLVRAGFGPYLEAVIDSHIVGVAKPDPHIFRIALERLGVSADECVHVGDLPLFDVAGASAAGIACVLLDPHGLHGAVACAARIARITDLPALLGLGN